MLAPPGLVAAAGLAAPDATDAFTVPLPAGSPVDAREWWALVGPAADRSSARAPAGRRTPWTVRAATADTVVAGGGDRHLDLRLVLHVRPVAGWHELVAVTVAQRYDALGRARLALTRPFRRRFLPEVLRRLTARPGV
ncbi:DUF2867 domain-containing protein [Geodermatophilus sp. SYSU D00525]